jgi:hypothetical protein
MLANFRKALLFRRFPPRLALLSWDEQSVDEDECGELIIAAYSNLKGNINLLAPEFYI